MGFVDTSQISSSHILAQNPHHCNHSLLMTPVFLSGRHLKTSSNFVGILTWAFHSSQLFFQMIVRDNWKFAVAVLYILSSDKAS